MAKRSAGILLFRRDPLEVLLVHPGGPFWAKKDLGAWSIPKGEHEEGEDAMACAIREFGEETGSEPNPGELIDLGTIKQKAGKVVQAWALEGDLDASAVTLEHVFDAMATAQRPVPGLPGGGPRGVVFPGRGGRADQPRTGRVSRPAA